jgi:hypothetical protein
MSDFTLWHWTDDQVEAAVCAEAGLDRIGLDIDTLGKKARQAGQDSWISPHELTSLPRLRARLPGHCLFLRTNALHAGSRDEIEAALDAGVDLLMLPNFQTIHEVEAYLGIVRGRVQVVPLVERRAALPLIAAFPALGIEEFHVGLNDLALDFGVADRLSLLLHRDIEAMCELARAEKLKFGIGGVALPGQDGLPVAALSVIAQHGRLGSTGAMLARSFWCGERSRRLDRLPSAIAAIRQAVAETSRMRPVDARRLLESQMTSAA